MAEFLLVKKFRLEKFKIEDFDFYYQLVACKRVMAMITEKAIPYDEAKSKFDRLIQNNNLHSVFGTFKITDASSNDFVGLVKLTINKIDDKKAELGFMLLPEYWGKGIAGKAAKRLIKMAKSENQIERIIAIIDPKNMASRRILIKNKFLTKELKSFDGLPGEVLELKLYGNKKQ